MSEVQFNTPTVEPGWRLDFSTDPWLGDDEVLPTPEELATAGSPPHPARTRCRPSWRLGSNAATIQHGREHKMHAWDFWPRPAQSEEHPFCVSCYAETMLGRSERHVTYFQPPAPTHAFAFTWLSDAENLPAPPNIRNYRCELYSMCWNVKALEHAQLSIVFTSRHNDDTL